MAINNTGYFSLKEGDETYMAFSVSVIGEVTKNGEYILKDGDRLSDLISSCGGFTGKANISHVKIVRNDSVVTIDFSKYLKTGEEKLNPILRPGDFIVVKKSGWSYFLTGLDVLYKAALTINTIIIAYVYINKFIVVSLEHLLHELPQYGLWFEYNLSEDIAKCFDGLCDVKELTEVLDIVYDGNFVYENIDVLIQNAFDKYPNKLDEVILNAQKIYYEDHPNEAK